VPTFQTSPHFDRDWKGLTAEAQARFQRAVIGHFVPDLEAGALRPGLRVKPVQGTQGVWEMTWAPHGRATFSYGPQQREGEPHVIWRRVGTHEVFRSP
jgi:hypothetical protein